MTRKQLEDSRRLYLRNKHPYDLYYWEDYDFSILRNILWHKKAGRNNATFNDCFIMADTETSKKPSGIDNHVVAWTISIRAMGMNIVTLWGRKPSDLIHAITKLHNHMDGDETYIYWHNMPYDWVFIRKYAMEIFGTPESQLNVKSHYPIYIKFKCGIQFRDSLILAQRSLEKWAIDMDVEHQKAVGFWDYDKLRNQDEEYSEDELTYIEHDTLAGVECLDKMRIHLNKSVYSMPYTATGIPREDVYKLAKANNGRDLYLRLAPAFALQCMLEDGYHGGYAHTYRHIVGEILKGDIQCRDFASSYPAVLLQEKYPMEAFFALDDKSVDYILNNADDYAFLFRLILIKPRLKNDFVPMPALQFSKAESVNAILDNGRILCADYVAITITEQDLIVLSEQYDWEGAICTQIKAARKDYLPRWLTDYIFDLYIAKTQLKGGDPVAYALAKAKLNSIYGMMVQKPCKDTINEDYHTGEYILEKLDMEELYNKHVSSPKSVLPYQWGVWVTAYAFRNLFRLGKCVDYDNGGIWAYSDTDSCYATKWNERALERYNESAKAKMIANGYGPVIHNGREYWLGVAEPDARYSEFVALGAKRYCGRDFESGQLKITVAGVPKKKGALCLKDDIRNFKKGFIFDGKTTGKLTHTYSYVEEAYIDEWGNETGDSINLTPCDYLLDSIYVVDWQKLLEEEITMQTYEDQ